MSGHEFDHVVLRLRGSGAITSAPPICFLSMQRDNFSILTFF